MVRLLGVVFALFSLWAMASLSAAEPKTISIIENAPYANPELIQENIRNECTDLGVKLSAFTKDYLKKKAWKGELVSGLSGSGYELSIKITHAVSVGGAMRGHMKSVSILAELFKGGELVDSYETTRESGGGVFGAYKGSCAVLGRCTKVLGKDIAEWLENREK